MAETVLNQTEQRIDQNLDGQKQKFALKRTFGLVLSVLMIALTAYVFKLQNENDRVLNQATGLSDHSSSGQASNYRAYVQQYKETKQQLDATIQKLELVQKELDQVSAELAATKATLTDTQGMLTQAQTENNRLSSEIKELEALRAAENVSSIPELEGRIDALKKTNAEVTSELSGVKSELRAFQADFSNLAEGKSLVVLFQNKISLVKSRMRYLRQEAYFARVAAQKEKDRIAALNGNSGFLFKDGRLRKTGDVKGFAIDVKMLQ